MSKKVVVVDYGIGNVLSVVRAFEYCGANVTLTAEHRGIEKADYLVLPGVGAFADGMQGLSTRGLIESIQEFCKYERPFLGICLGMQMMMEASEEFGMHDGLGIFKGRVVKIPAVDVNGNMHKVPNVGWYGLKTNNSWENTLLCDFEGANPEVYVVHSYMARTEKSIERAAYYEYGGKHITAMIAKGYLFGCQFHPEKSGKVGLQMINRFLNL